MGAPTTFTTDRLHAHRVGPADEEFLAAMWSDPRVVATLGGPRDVARVREDIVRWNGYWDERGVGLWILRRRSDATPLGWTMLHHIDTGGPAFEVGWTVAADHWRQGYASEAAARAVEIGFTDCGLEKIVSLTLVHNVASRGVMERLGFTYDRHIEHVGLPHVLYRLTKQEWETRNG